MFQVFKYFFLIMIYIGLFFYFYVSQSQILNKKPLDRYKIKEILHFLAKKKF